MTRWAFPRVPAVRKSPRNLSRCESTMKIWRSIAASSLSTLLLSISTCEASSSIARIYGECSSSEIEGGYSAMLRPDTTLHWSISDDMTSLEATLEYDGAAWISFGFSPTGGMIGSSVFLAEPSSSKVSFNKILTKAVAGLEIIDDERLSGSSLSQSEVSTSLTIQYKITEDSSILQDGAVPMVYAIGESPDLGYHRHRGAFLIDLKTCGGSSTYWESDDHETAFAMHGFFAAVAMGVALPVAITAAMFRKTIPRQWIYLHVCGHCLAFLLCLLSVASAVVGVSLKGSSHFQHGHHWFGLLLVVLLNFQLISGIRRPPLKEVKMTDNLHTMNEAPQEESRRTMCGGRVVLPNTRREKWQWMHRSIAMSIVLIALFQIRSGIRLFSHQYQHDAGNLLVAYWGYVIFLILSGITLRIGQVYYDRQTKGARDARRKARRSVKRSERQSYGDGDDEDNETTAMEINVI